MQAVLDSETGFDGFRREARSLLAQGVRPEDVDWSVRGANGGLFVGWGGTPAQQAGVSPQPTEITVPAFFVDLARTVILHRDPQRFTLLYRLLWRLVHEPALRHDPLDDDLLRARQMSKQVGHDMHKMRAFVRFRPVQDEAGETTHVAWFEPAHRVVDANAPWFRRRFANMRWAILSPDACVHWDLRELRVEAGADRTQAPAADAGEGLWLTYYRNIFNPARLKLDMMRKEMPRRYWANLPEAVLISPLAAAAQERSAHMVATEPAPRRHRSMAIAPVRMSPQAGTLESLHAQVLACRDCPHAGAATQAVNGEGAMHPALMFVGEQPGDQEDLHGRPFVGPAGQLLDRALAQGGIDRSQVFLTNAVRHFHFELRGKRRIHKSPGQREAAACAQWLEHEIALVQPQALVALGATAARALLGRAVAVTQERGRWHMRADGRAVLVTLHPSALLRMPPAEQTNAFAAFVSDLAAAAVGPG